MDQSPDAFPKLATSSTSPQKTRSRKDYGDPFYSVFNLVRGETALWSAVITQALMDALSKSNNPELLYQKHAAIRWLTGNSEDFQTVCHFAGMDPDYVRRKAQKAIASPTPWRAEAGKGRRYLERRAYRERKHRETTNHTDEKLSDPVITCLRAMPSAQPTSLETVCA